MMAELRRGGFEGAIYPVNPGYDEVDGYRCYPSIAEVPEPVDLAILGVANARVEQALRRCGGRRRGQRGHVLVAVRRAPAIESGTCVSGCATIADRARHGDVRRQRHGVHARWSRSLRATGFLTPEHLRHGPVTFLSHSGSAFSALAFNDRGIGFNLLVSSGQEVVTTMADYMEYALALESDPGAGAAARDRARSRRRSGRSWRGRPSRASPCSR